VPEEKNYSVIVPPRWTAWRYLPPDERTSTVGPQARAGAITVGPGKCRFVGAAAFPAAGEGIGKGAKFYRINGKRGIMASAGDISASWLSRRCSLAKFLKYNDLDARTQLVPGRCII
jgi:hypothetical protein